MASKFFSIEVRANLTGEIEDIITSKQLGDSVQSFDQIQDKVIEISNERRCKGSIRNEFGQVVLDFNYSEVCESNICFAWQSDEILDDFIEAHPNVEPIKKAV